MTANPPPAARQGSSTNRGERTPSAPVEVTDREQYQGSYWSEELETQYTITPKGHKLIAAHIRHGEIRLLPAGQHRFTTTEWFMPEVNFLRDASNRVSGVTLGGGRVAGVRFIRTSPTPAVAPKP